MDDQQPGLEQRLDDELGNAAGDGPNAALSASALADALGRAFDLLACVVYEQRHDSFTAVASFVPRQPLREALTKAYLENALSPSLNERLLAVADWLPQHEALGELAEQLAPTDWTISVPIESDGKAVGAVWMLGEADRPRPDERLTRRVAELGLSALVETLGLGPTLPETDEVQLLEELGGVLTQRRPLQERIEELVKRSQAASGFSSVHLLTRAWDSADSIVSALYTQDQGLIREPAEAWRMTLEWAAGHFRDHPGPLLIREPTSLAGLRDGHVRWMARNGIRYLVIAPLHFQNELLGVLLVCSTLDEPATWRGLRVFTALGAHVAAVLKSVLLVEQVEAANRQLQANHQNTVRTLAYAAEARDPFTGGHLRRLEQYVRAIAQAIELPQDEVDDVCLGAVVHDVGKLRIPDSILLKPAALDPEERELIRQHPLFGEAILEPSGIPRPALQIARWHHERWDGRGYPDGIGGKDLPLPVRIVTLADVFDALISRRPYKPAWPADRALAEIHARRGSYFDPALVEVFDVLWREGTIEAIIAGQDEAPPDASRAA